MYNCADTITCLLLPRYSTINVLLLRLAYDWIEIFVTLPWQQCSRLHQTNQMKQSHNTQVSILQWLVKPSLLKNSQPCLHQEWTLKYIMNKKYISYKILFLKISENVYQFVQVS